MELSCTWWRICCNMCTKKRRHKANKVDMTYIKEQRSINRWPCVYQVYLVVQLGLSHSNGPWSSPVARICTRVLDSYSIWRASFLSIWSPWSQDILLTIAELMRPTYTNFCSCKVFAELLVVAGKTQQPQLTAFYYISISPSFSSLCYIKVDTYPPESKSFRFGGRPHWRQYHVHRKTIGLVERGWPSPWAEILILVFLFLF